MRHSLFLLVMLCSSSAFAKGYVDAYQNITRAACINASGESVNLNLETQTLIGEIVDSVLTKLSNEEIKKDNPDVKVELTRDFFQSGFDFLGGVVTGEESFGTLGIILDRSLDKTGTQEMPILYMEAMTGRQVQTKMVCTFAP